MLSCIISLQKSIKKSEKLQSQNKSLTRGLQVLKEILYSDKPLTAIILCQKLDIDKSTMSRLITSLMNEGFIKYLGNTKEIVKADVLDIMSAKASREVLIQRSQKLLEEIFTLTNESSYLAVYENETLLYLNQVDNSSRVIKMRNSVGLYAPLHCTAMGKVMLAFGDVDLKRLELNEYTHNTLTKARYLQKEIEMTKSRGYAIEADEYEYGLSSVAVPLFNKNNEFLGAVGVSGLSARMDTPNMHEFGVSILRQSAQEFHI